MSLESKIEKLTGAIEALTAQLASNQQTTTEVEVTEPIVEQLPEDTSNVSISDIKTLAKKLVSAGVERSTIKEVIANHGAGSLADLKEEMFQAVYEELEVIGV